MTSSTSQFMDKTVLKYTSTGHRSPGPAAYHVKPTIGTGSTDPTIEKNPAYSIQGRRTKDPQPIGPGPAFDTSRLNHHGVHRPPGGLLSQRFRDSHQDDCMPSPADYCVPDERTKVGPRMRPNVGRRRGAEPEWPAPNAYLLPDTLDRRAPRLGGRFLTKKNTDTPGPNQYALPHGDLYLPGNSRLGRSLGGRPPKSQQLPTPGPADYDGGVRPKCRGISMYTTTFGSRWSDAVSIFAVPADNEYKC